MRERSATGSSRQMWKSSSAGSLVRWASSSIEDLVGREFIFLFLLHFPLFFSRVCVRCACAVVLCVVLQVRMKKRENVLLLPLAAAATSRPWLLGVYVHSRRCRLMDWTALFLPTTGARRWRR
jgi:hypothetical protein